MAYLGDDGGGEGGPPYTEMVQSIKEVLPLNPKLKNAQMGLRASRIRKALKWKS